MSRLTREEKKNRRLTRLLEPLMNRREFVVATAATGVVVTTPLGLVAAIDNSDDALRTAYWVLWGAVDGNIVGHDSTLEDPLDGVGEGYNRGSADVPRPDRPGPHGPNARRWLMWRLRKTFMDRYNDESEPWDKESPYVLLNSARIGVKARDLAGAGRMVNVRQLRMAFDAVKKDPKSKPGIDIDDYWCF